MAAPRTALWFAAADGTRHPLIEVSSDSSDEEVAADGSCEALALLDPAAVQAGDASEDDESGEELATAGVWNYELCFCCSNQSQHGCVFQTFWAKRERERC